MKRNHMFAPYKRAKQIRQTYRQLRDGFRASEYMSVQDTAMNALDMQEDISELKKFIKDPFWKGCKNPPREGQNEPLLHHLLWFNYGKGDNHRKRAWRHSNLVEFLCSQGVEVDELLDEIKARGGWKGVGREKKQSENEGNYSEKISESKNPTKQCNDSISPQDSKPTGCISAENIEVKVEVTRKDFERLMRISQGQTISADIVCKGRGPDSFVFFYADFIDFGEFK